VGAIHPPPSRQLGQQHARVEAGAHCGVGGIGGDALQLDPIGVYVELGLAGLMHTYAAVQHVANAEKSGSGYDTELATWLTSSHQ
jgi:hypothetical protein